MGLSQLADRRGETLPPGDWLEITQVMIDGFARLTGDEQWIHVDVARSIAESPYGAPVAHGLLILALIPKLMQGAAKWAAYTTGINYGLNKVRFPAPVRAGQRIRAHQTLAAVDAYRDEAVKVTLAITIEIEGETTPGCVAEMIVLLFP
ncbi:MAG: MaoC family dehydratase [Rhodospirillaceae bacterium]|nr:MaoC family dehydratase [Rhodospirillaceae bacterium]